MARAFGMSVMACDPYVPVHLAREQRVELVELDDLLASSDFIILHTAATPETHYLINSESLAKMMSGV